MKKKNIILGIALITIVFCSAQKIEIKKIFGGYKYSQNGVSMSMGDLENTMESNAGAFKLMKRAKANGVLASIMGGVGGGLIGYPIGQAIGGGKANWALAGIGAGFITVGFFISSSASKKEKQAVELYNASLEGTSLYKFKPKFNIVANGNGVGISMNF